MFLLWVENLTDDSLELVHTFQSINPKRQMFQKWKEEEEEGEEEEGGGGGEGENPPYV